MKLISPHMLHQMRRGAEHLYLKHRDNLPIAVVTIKQDIAKELKLPTKDVKATSINSTPAEKVGLFDDEEVQDHLVMPDVMTVVKLTDYITALQEYKSEESKEAAKAAK